MNRRFLSYENIIDRIAQTGCHFLKVETKSDNVVIDGKNVFDQPVKNDIRTYENIRKIAIVHRDDYTTSCILNYPDFKKCR